MISQERPETSPWQKGPTHESLITQVARWKVEIVHQPISGGNLMKFRTLLVLQRKVS